MAPIAQQCLAGLSDGVEDVEQTAGRARKAIQTGDDNGIALGERLEHLGCKSSPLLDCSLLGLPRVALEE
jgi:hypothetical protein